jgi:riboflavin synthase
MFTGLIEGTGRLVGVERREGSGEGGRVRVEAVGMEAEVGESVAVDGCCLTVVEVEDGVWGFDVLEETFRRTRLGRVAVGAEVNVERALRVGERLGGHFVTGHVDGVGRVVRWERVGGERDAEGDYVLEVEVGRELGALVVEKGSIAINGISLTVAAVEGCGVRIYVIPHTRQVTNLRGVQRGDWVNVEFDLLAKLVQKSVAYYVEELRKV